MLAAQPPTAVPTPFQSASLYVGDLNDDVTEVSLENHIILCRNTSL
jgi:hypothetical protein